MKAAVYQGNRIFAIQEIPVPQINASQVLVKVKYCAICGTDVHTVMYDVLLPDSIIGHEYCGVIVEVGSKVTQWKIGDRVIGGGGDSPVGIPYGITADPRYSYKDSLPKMGTNGAYAEFVRLESWEPMAIPESVSDEEATMCEPVAIAVRAIRNSQMKLGDSVAIIGSGPIGLLCMQVARAAGAGSVFVSEPAPARREVALQLGADMVIDPTTEDPVDKIISATNGIGPDIVFECAAAKNTLDQALTMTKRYGQVVLVAIPWEPVELMPVEWIGREVNLQTSASKSPSDWSEALELIRRKEISLAPLLSDASFVDLENLQGAFESLYEPQDQVKIVIQP